MVDGRLGNYTVHEATYTEDVLVKVGEGPQHSSAKRVARFAQQNGIANLVLTHFSPRYGSQTIAEIEEEAKRFYNRNLLLAEDFTHLVIGKEGQLEVMEDSDLVNN